MKLAGFAAVYVGFVTGGFEGCCNGLIFRVENGPYGLMT